MRQSARRTEDVRKKKRLNTAANRRRDGKPAAWRQIDANKQKTCKAERVSDDREPHATWQGEKARNAVDAADIGL